jgi:hypothetical protein
MSRFSIEFSPNLIEGKFEKVAAVSSHPDRVPAKLSFGAKSPLQRRGQQ